MEPVSVYITFTAKCIRLGKIFLLQKIFFRCTVPILSLEKKWKKIVKIHFTRLQSFTTFHNATIIYNCHFAVNYLLVIIKIRHRSKLKVKE